MTPFSQIAAALGRGLQALGRAAMQHPWGTLIVGAGVVVTAALSRIHPLAGPVFFAVSTALASYAYTFCHD